MYVCMYVSFKFPALATPNEVDRVMKDWWRMTSLQEYLKAFCFYLLDWRLHCFANFILFIFVEENSLPLLKQQLPEREGFCDSWLDVTTHSETQTLFCTDLRSISLGVAEAGTLNLDLRALKSQNPIFFLRNKVQYQSGKFTFQLETEKAFYLWELISLSTK